MKAILDADPARPGRGRRRVGHAASLTIAIFSASLAMAVPSGARAADEPSADERMMVTGRVLDPSGKPVPDAAVMVVVRWKLSDRPTLLNAVFGPLTAHQGRCDGSGRFRVEMPRTSSARHDQLTVTAMATGHGMGWAELDPDADPPAADIALRTEQIIRGRLFDVQGQPARGVALWVRSVDTIARGELSTPIFRPDYAEPPWHELPGWPGPAISDDDGRFTLRGMGPEVECLLRTDDPRYALAPTVISTCNYADARALGVMIPVIKVGPGPDAKPIVLTVHPARTITGRVTYADTGRPVSHVLVTTGEQRYEADGEGRYRVPGAAAALLRDAFGISAQSPDPGPYLIAVKQGEWPKGAVEQSVDLALTRGMVIHGKVTEEGTGRPVAGAVVLVNPDEIPRAPSRDRIAPGVTGADGSYRVAAPQGPGYLIVQGPDSYVLREFGGGSRGVFQGRRGRDRLYAHAFRAIEVKPGGPDEFDFALRRGASLHSRVLDPDGRPVQDAWLYSRLILQSAPTGGWRRWFTVYGRGRGHVRDGRFALHGLDPTSDAEVPAYFLEPDRKLGAAARFSARAATNGEVTVRLQPCGMAKARLVGPDGKPLERYAAGGLVSMVVTPGPPGSGRAAKEGPLFADEAGVARLDPVNYGPDFQSDAQGRVTWPVLIPSASYRIVDATPAFGGGEPVVRREFAVGPGEALELDDIRIEKPERLIK